MYTYIHMCESHVHIHTHVLVTCTVCDFIANPVHTRVLSLLLLVMAFLQLVQEQQWQEMGHNVAC